MDEIKSKGGLSRNDPTITRFCTPGTTNPDTRAIIPALRQQTLKGANLVFTGVVPTNVPLKNSAVYRTAIGLGANVTENVVSSATTSNKQEFTTHVIAARLGTEKAYRASRMRGVKLVGVEWLWCCAQRWEWVDERLFPVPSREQGNGENTPDSSRGTPTLAEMSKSNRGRRSGKSSRNEAKDLLRSRIPTPNDIIDSINPVSFSKDEMDQMDKEVEEYMLSDKDDDEEGDMLGSVSGSSSRNSGRSSTDSSKSSSSSSRSPTPPTSLEGYRKRKKELSDKLDAIRNKRRALITQPVKENHNNEDDDDQDSDSSSSENSVSSDDDFQIGEMLEKQIND